MMLRIILALLMGGLIGMERERKRRPAGFRTYMLVALGAALTVILSQYLDYMINNPWAEISASIGVKTDASRFGAQVINGVGFLGAGTIIVTGRQEVKGLTTAAGLWASACMGLAIGAGFYECMIVGFILIFLCMRILPLIENAVMAKARNMNIYVEMDSVENVVAEEAGEPPLHREGYRGGTWVLLDYGCIAIHVFNAEAREFYGLERLWRDGKEVDISAILEEK